MLGHSVGEIVLLAGWIAGAGILVGILAGLFGIGGGAIIVPVLYEVFRALGVPEDLRMQLCIGTSLAIIVPTTVRSYLAHKKKGAVIPHVLRTWTVPAFVGVAIGSVAAAYAPAPVFKIAFVIFAGFIADAHAVRRRPLEFGHGPAEARRAGRLWLHHRSVFVAGGRERRRGVERGAHALWPADAAGGRHLRRHRRADHHRRHHRLHAGRLEISWTSFRRCRSALSR